MSRKTTAKNKIIENLILEGMKEARRKNSILLTERPHDAHGHDPAMGFIYGAEFADRACRDGDEKYCGKGEELRDMYKQASIGQGILAGLILGYGYLGTAAGQQVLGQGLRTIGGAGKTALRAAFTGASGKALGTAMAALYYEDIVEIVNMVGDLYASAAAEKSTGFHGGRTQLAIQKIKIKDHPDVENTIKEFLSAYSTWNTLHVKVIKEYLEELMHTKDSHYFSHIYDLLQEQEEDEIPDDTDDEDDEDEIPDDTDDEEAPAGYDDVQFSKNYTGWIADNAIIGAFASSELIEAYADDIGAEPTVENYLNVYEKLKDLTDKRTMFGKMGAANRNEYLLIPEMYAKRLAQTVVESGMRATASSSYEKPGLMYCHPQVFALLCIKLHFKYFNQFEQGGVYNFANRAKKHIKDLVGGNLNEQMAELDPGIGGSGVDDVPMDDCRRAAEPWWCEYKKSLRPRFRQELESLEATAKENPNSGSAKTLEREKERVRREIESRKQRENEDWAEDMELLMGSASVFKYFESMKVMVMDQLVETPPGGVSSEEFMNLFATFTTLAQIDPAGDVMKFEEAYKCLAAYQVENFEDVSGKNVAKPGLFKNIVARMIFHAPEEAALGAMIGAGKNQLSKIKVKRAAQRRYKRTGRKLKNDQMKKIIKRSAKGGRWTSVVAGVLLWGAIAWADPFNIVDKKKIDKAFEDCLKKAEKYKRIQVRAARERKRSQMKENILLDFPGKDKINEGDFRPGVGYSADVIAPSRQNPSGYQVTATGAALGMAQDEDGNLVDLKLPEEDLVWEFTDEQVRDVINGFFKALLEMEAEISEAVNTTHAWAKQVDAETGKVKDKQDKEKLRCASLIDRKQTHNQFRDLTLGTLEEIKALEGEDFSGAVTDENYDAFVDSIKESMKQLNEMWEKTKSADLSLMIRGGTTQNESVKKIDYNPSEVLNQYILEQRPSTSGNVTPATTTVTPTPTPQPTPAPPAASAGGFSPTTTTTGALPVSSGPKNYSVKQTGNFKMTVEDIKKNLTDWFNDAKNHPDTKDQKGLQFNIKDLVNTMEETLHFMGYTYQKEISKEDVEGMVVNAGQAKSMYRELTDFKSFPREQMINEYESYRLDVIRDKSFKRAWFNQRTDNRYGAVLAGSTQGTVHFGKGAAPGGQEGSYFILGAVRPIGFDSWILKSNCKGSFVRGFGSEGDASGFIKMQRALNGGFFSDLVDDGAAWAKSTTTTPKKGSKKIQHHENYLKGSGFDAQRELYTGVTSDNVSQNYYDSLVAYCLQAPGLTKSRLKRIQSYGPGGGKSGDVWRLITFIRHMSDNTAVKGGGRPVKSNRPQLGNPAYYIDLLTATVNFYGIYTMWVRLVHDMRKYVQTGRKSIHVGKGYVGLNSLIKLYQDNGIVKQDKLGNLVTSTKVSKQSVHYKNPRKCRVFQQKFFQQQQNILKQERDNILNYLGLVWALIRIDQFLAAGFKE